MNTELLHSRKFLIILAGTFVTIVVLVVVLSFLNKKKKAMPQPTSPSASTQFQKITPVSQRVGSGTSTGLLNSKRTPQEQVTELGNLLPGEGDGFLVNFDEVSEKYEVYISNPFETSQEKAVLFLQEKYPDIPLNTFRFVNIPTVFSESQPYREEGFTIIPNSSGYQVFLTDPYDVSKKTAEVFIAAKYPNVQESQLSYVNTNTVNSSQSRSISAPSPTLTPTSSDNKTSPEIMTDFLAIFSGLTIDFNVDFPPTPQLTPIPTIASSNYDGITPNESPPPAIISETPLNVNPSSPISYSATTISSVTKCVQNITIYKQAASYTGVSWKVLAAIHYIEGGCNPNQSLVSGRAIGNIEPDVGKGCSASDTRIGRPYPLGGGCAFRNLLDTAVYGGFHLREKLSGRIPQSIPDLAYALGRYNGLGNRNCGKTPYPYCPPAFDNDDHIYAMSKYDKKHETMYLVYCADYTPCNPPVIFQRIGGLAVVNILSQQGY